MPSWFTNLSFVFGPDVCYTVKLFNSHFLSTEIPAWIFWNHWWISWRRFLSSQQRVGSNKILSTDCSWNFALPPKLTSHPGRKQAFTLFAENVENSNESLHVNEWCGCDVKCGWFPPDTPWQKEMADSAESQHCHFSSCIFSDVIQWSRLQYLHTYLYMNMSEFEYMNMVQFTRIPEHIIQPRDTWQATFSYPLYMRNPYLTTLVPTRGC